VRTNIERVQAIYEAFGKGDLTAILDKMSNTAAPLHRHRQANRGRQRRQRRQPDHALGSRGPHRLRVHKPEKAQRLQVHAALVHFELSVADQHGLRP
jgi:hypothetical protein